jgi:hypothetical protein
LLKDFKFRVKLRQYSAADGEQNCGFLVEDKASELACSCQVTSRNIATGTRLDKKIWTRISCDAVDHTPLLRSRLFLGGYTLRGEHRVSEFTALLSPLYCLDKCHILFSVLIRYYVNLIIAEGQKQKTKLWVLLDQLIWNKSGGYGSNTS